MKALPDLGNAFFCINTYCVVSYLLFVLIVLDFLIKKIGFVKTLLVYLHLNNKKTAAYSIILLF